MDEYYERFGQLILSELEQDIVEAMKPWGRVSLMPLQDAMRLQMLRDLNQLLRCGVNKESVGKDCTSMDHTRAGDVVIKCEVKKGGA